MTTFPYYSGISTKLSPKTRMKCHYPGCQEQAARRAEVQVSGMRGDSRQVDVCNQHNTHEAVLWAFEQ